jgi:hypothetical protein
MAEEKFTQLPIVQAGAATIAGVVKLPNIKSKLLTVSYILLFCSLSHNSIFCKL